jgi:hypothetical protein
MADVLLALLRYPFPDGQIQSLSEWNGAATVVCSVWPELDEITIEQWSGRSF